MRIRITGSTSTIITGDVVLADALGYTSGSFASSFSLSLFWEHRLSACFRASQRPALSERACQLVERLVQLEPGVNSSVCHYKLTKAAV